MSVQGIGNSSPVQKIVSQPIQKSLPESASPPTRASDRVELSGLGNVLAAAKNLPDVRTDKVWQIKQQIEAGTYEDDDKLNVTADRLLDELCSDAHLKFPWPSEHCGYDGRSSVLNWRGQGSKMRHSYRSRGKRSHPPAARIELFAERLRLATCWRHCPARSGADASVPPGTLLVKPAAPAGFDGKLDSQLWARFRISISRLPTPPFQPVV